jgi:hypothetical protein
VEGGDVRAEFLLLWQIEKNKEIDQADDDVDD